MWGNASHAPGLSIDGRAGVEVIEGGSGRVCDAGCSWRRSLICRPGGGRGLEKVLIGPSGSCCIGNLAGATASGTVAPNGNELPILDFHKRQIIWPDVVALGRMILPSMRLLDHMRSPAEVRLMMNSGVNMAVGTPIMVAHRAEPVEVREHFFSRIITASSRSAML